MGERIDDIEKIIDYWTESSGQNYTTMTNLLKSKDYSWALFIGHLVIEKLLKAHYVKKSKETCPSHTRPFKVVVKMWLRSFQ